MRRNQRGGVFVITLFALVGLVAILAAAASSARLAALAQTHRMEERRVALLIDAGIQRALVSLSTQTLAPTQSTDEWLTLGTQGGDRFKVGNGTFRMEIVDAGSFINLNTADQTQLEMLPLTAEQVDSLLDWKEQGQTARSDGGKDQYYNSLTNGYNTKLGRLDSIDELLLVKGFTAKAIFERQTDVVSNSTIVQGAADEQPTIADLCTVDSLSSNVGDTGQAKVQLGSARNPNALEQQFPGFGQLLFNARTSQTYGQVLTRVPLPTEQARNFVNQYSLGNAADQEGKVNLNTATESVLNAIPGLTPDIVSGIITKQSQGFMELGDLFDVPGYTTQIAAQTIDKFTVNSSSFLVRIVATVGSTTRSAVAVIQIKNDTAMLVKVYDQTENNMAEKWGWATDTTNEIDLKESQ